MIALIPINDPQHLRSRESICCIKEHHDVTSRAINAFVHGVIDSAIRAGLPVHSFIGERGEPLNSSVRTTAIDDQPTPIVEVLATHRVPGPLQSLKVVPRDGEHVKTPWRTGAGLRHLFSHRGQGTSG